MFVKNSELFMPEAPLALPQDDSFGRPYGFSRLIYLVKIWQQGVVV